MTDPFPSYAPSAETEQAADAGEEAGVLVGDRSSPSEVNPPNGSPIDSLGRSNSLTEQLL